MSRRPVGSVEELLTRSSRHSRALYRLVRSLLDEFEELTPWSLLYAPPADGEELSQRLGELLVAIAGVPQRVAIELAELRQRVVDEEERQAIDEAEFYFSALHQMTEADQQRLAATLVDRHAERPPTRAEADQLCELAADLKGKYTSATMSAVAALVGEGRDRGVALEARLFPEKAEEAERNRRLLDALERAARTHRAVVASFPWRGVLASWRRRRPVDRYALGDLVSLRAHLLNLMTVANRRALYSGDYQFLCGRETQLGERLRELEDLHVRTLDLEPEAHGTVEEVIYRRLEELLLAVAALLDIEVLREQLGPGAIEALRDGRPPASEPGGARLGGLVPLVREEDVKTFLELLVGAVRKRASISLRGADRPLPVTAAEQGETALARAAPAVRLDPRTGRAYAERLVGALKRLTDPASPRWRGFQMVQKLQARLGTLPPALLHEVGPFLGELESELLPILAEASTAGAVPASAVEALKNCSERLRAHDLSRPDAAAEMAGDLGRVARLIDSLRAASESLRASG